MVRIFNAYIPTRTLLLATLDMLLIVAVLLAIRALGFPATATPGLVYSHATFKILVACGVCMLCMYYFDLYEPQVLANLWQVTARLSQVLGTVCLVLAAVYYAFPSIELSRELLFLGTGVIGLALIGGRKLFYTLNGLAPLAQRAILLGNGPLSSCLAQELDRCPELGMRLVGYVGDPSAAPNAGNGLSWLDGLEQVWEVIKRERVTRVIVTMEERRGRLPLDLLLHMKSQGICVEDGADVYEQVTGKVPLTSLRLGCFVFSPSFKLTRLTELYKRAFSILLSALGLLLVLPLMGLIALAIRLDSPGPALFRQKRIGMGGRAFVLFKFRSMRINADADGVPRPVQENDDRVTRVGRWLRRTRLDELPQLYNILRGEMSFVGPRPFVPEQERVLAEQIPFYRYRWAVKPGATGWAQVHRAYCATIEDNVEKLAYDLFYIKNMSVGLDFVVLFQTLKILLLGRGAR